MNRRNWIGLGCIVVGLAFVAGRASSDDKKADKPKGAAAAKMPTPAEMKDMMEKMAAAMKPGEHHKKLDHFVGSWDVEISMFMDPAMPAMKTKGKSEAKWVLGDRFVQDNFSGEMILPDPNSPMGMGKKQYDGIGMTGYDNNRNMYVGTWAHTMGTDIVYTKGTMDPEGKTLTMYGEMDEPSIHVYGRLVKYVTKIVDDDTHIFQIYDLAAGPDYKVIEMKYTRKKAADKSNGDAK